jgi:branched-chain amino acid transport system permease protein
MHFAGISSNLLLGQLLAGLVNGSFYALLSMGIALIFGVMSVVNFAHGAMYMLGAFFAWLLLTTFGLPYWSALIVSPLVIAAAGALIERTLLRPLQNFSHLYGLLATFAVALVVEGLIQRQYGSSGLPYANPLPGAARFSFVFLPWYRLWVVALSLVVTIGIWFAIEHTSLGVRIRAANEKPDIVESFGINVPLLMTLVFGLGSGLAALAGVLAAPIYQVSPSMGSDLVIVVFAVVVIGGMRSIGGAIATGYVLGIAEGLTQIVYPQAANIVIFLVMALALLVRPSGLFSKSEAVR